jgi:hypothetical protein
MCCVLQPWQSRSQILLVISTSELPCRGHVSGKLGQKHHFRRRKGSIYIGIFAESHFVAGQGCSVSRYFPTLSTVPITIGIDNRTERTRYKINYDTTYQKIFERVNQEAVKGKTKHLIVMLGKLISQAVLTMQESRSHIRGSCGWKLFSRAVL